MNRTSLAFVLCLFGMVTGFQPLSAEVAPSASPNGALQVIVLAGASAKNILSSKSAGQPLVEVRGLDRKPITGAVVTIEGPDVGTGVIFANGARAQSLVTDTDGRASVQNMAPVGIGSFLLNVTAQYDRQIGTATIEQTNFPNERAERANDLNAVGLSRRAKYGIFAAIAAGAAAGLAVGLARGNSSSAVVTSGPPTVGAPH